MRVKRDSEGQSRIAAASLSILDVGSLDWVPKTRTLLVRSTSGVGALQREQLAQRADEGASATTTQIATSASGGDTRASACVYLGCCSLPQTQGAPTNDTQSTRLLRVKSLRLSNDLVCQGIADGVR